MSPPKETPAPTRDRRSLPSTPSSLMDDWDQLFDGEMAIEPIPEIEEEPAPEAAPLSDRYLGFRLGEEFYAVPLLGLSEVVRSQEVTYVPRLQPFLRGIISVRGAIVPIVDLRRRLAFDESAREAAAARVADIHRVAEGERVLIARCGGEAFGLLVNEVTEPFSLEASEVEEPPPTLPRRLLEFVQGIGRVQGRIYTLLDLDVVLRFDAVSGGRARKEVSP